MFPSSDRDHVERAKGFKDGLNKMDSLSADYDKTLPLFGTKIYINDIIVDSPTKENFNSLGFNKYKSDQFLYKLKLLLYSTYN